MKSSKDALYYWDAFVAAKERYRENGGLNTLNYYQQNLLLEIQVGMLLGFIEEMFTNPSPPAHARLASLKNATKRKEITGEQETISLNTGISNAS